MTSSIQALENRKYKWLWFQVWVYWRTWSWSRKETQKRRGSGRSKEEASRKQSTLMTVVGVWKQNIVTVDWGRHGNLHEEGIFIKNSVELRYHTCVISFLWATYSFREKARETGKQRDPCSTAASFTVQEPIWCQGLNLYMHATWWTISLAGNVYQLSWKRGSKLFLLPALLNETFFTFALRSVCPTSCQQ